MYTHARTHQMVHSCSPLESPQGLWDRRVKSPQAGDNGWGLCIPTKTCPDKSMWSPLWSYVCAVRVHDYTCMGVMVGTTRWFVCWCPRDASNNWFTGNCVCVCAYRGPCSWTFCCEACCLQPVDCLHWSLQPSVAASATHCETKVTQSWANDKSISLRLIRKHRVTDVAVPDLLDLFKTCLNMHLPYSYGTGFYVL